MPRFAVLDADNLVVNIVALARKEDFLQCASHGEGEDASPVWVDTDHHLVMHGGSDLVEITPRTGAPVVGGVYRDRDGKFGPPPRPHAGADTADLVSEVQARGLIVSNPEANA